MRYVRLGRSGLTVSAVGLGASALGGVFEAVSDEQAVLSVDAALEAVITLFELAPAYGATRSERVLGQALAGVSHDRYMLSTKVGKATDASGRDLFDYFEDGVRRSLEAFGPERLKIGSDSPVCTCVADYATTVELLIDFASARSGDERVAVLGGACARFYGLEPPPVSSTRARTEGGAS